jgi:hypothetical protein
VGSLLLDLDLAHIAKIPRVFQFARQDALFLHLPMCCAFAFMFFSLQDKTHYLSAPANVLCVCLSHVSVGVSHIKSLCAARLSFI